MLTQTRGTSVPCTSQHSRMPRRST
uniref:Uncharacterized protein n=1 Tax=Anguilla anguilla TaxID=7936 RepID=A0A0E9UD12_ANGAN